MTPMQAASATTDSRTRLEAGPEALIRSKDELATEFRSLVREGEELLKSTTHLSAEALAQARERFRGKLRVAQERLGEVSHLAGARGRQVAIATDDYVHDSPWTAIGVAAGIGFVFGAMLTRRSG